MNVSDEAEIVQSASPPFSLTDTLPSSTSTVQLPAPSISKRYFAVRPAAFDGSTRDSSVSKNSLGLSMARETTAPARVRAAAWRASTAAAPPEQSPGQQQPRPR